MSVSAIGRAVTAGAPGGPTVRAAASERTLASHTTYERTLNVGDEGEDVRELKRDLRRLDYLPGRGDQYTQKTYHAVMAFQKINGIDRDGVAGRQTYGALQDPKAPQLADVSEGTRFEVDKSSQTAYMVRDGKVDYIVNATTGNPNLADGTGEETPKGNFHVERKIDGWRESEYGRLYKPSYFVGGIAVHGSPSVVAYKDSHGCVRVPMHNAQRVFDDLPVGEHVVVHR